MSSYFDAHGKKSWRLQTQKISMSGTPKLHTPAESQLILKKRELYLYLILGWNCKMNLIANWVYPRCLQRYQIHISAIVIYNKSRTLTYLICNQWRAARTFTNPVAHPGKLPYHMTVDTRDRSGKEKLIQIWMLLARWEFLVRFCWLKKLNEYRCGHGLMRELGK